MSFQQKINVLRRRYGLNVRQATWLASWAFSEEDFHDR